MTLKHKPFVSVIMNCYNSAEFLNEALESILSQTYSFFEVIFWDNRSTDHSSEIFKSKSDNRLKYYLAPIHTSLGEARNQAIKKSNGDLIAFLDCDDLWFPTKLEEQIPVFEKQSIGIVICDTLYFNEKRVIKQLYKKQPPPSGKVFSKLLTQYYISLETVIIRRIALESLSEWFDSRFEVIEEYDLFVRISYFWELGYVNKILSKWRVHNNSLTWKKPELFPVETNLFIEKITEMYPQIKSDLESELNTIKANISIDQSLIFWKKNERKKAIEIIKPYLFKNTRATIINCFIMIFGYKMFSLIYNLKKGL